MAKADYQFVVLRSTNIRELSKKEKIMGLNFMSWILSAMLGCVTMAYSTLYALIVFVTMFISFYIAEFFDEDITDILFGIFTLESDIEDYYA
ncbi:hypothetical protein [Helicobacter cetorum]|uniref:VirB3 type IV secretion protein n=1 Tax=Helicobacter cetorum (strain ATCC BAA-429 / MIT 00-7128) TaxID=182217 RepID=I0EMI1_HELC0|nr:hypothetical protein [Helicobacter cetorum]AFI04150.1 hypothetical protein HCW_04405 [Helicobacter cetorum MIT 00-7128]